MLDIDSKQGTFVDENRSYELIFQKGNIINSFQKANYNLAIIESDQRLEPNEIKTYFIEDYLKR